MLQLLAGERQKRESSKAVQACNDWLRMGPGRVLRDLWRLYKETQQNASPTQSWNTLADWSSRYNWQERAKLYDTKLEEQKTARAKEIMQSGLALSHERVEKLKELAALLWKELQTYDKRWLPDVKQIGAGKFAERVDIVRFNSALIGEYRATLDDIAKEMGHRVQKRELTGKDGGPMQHQLLDFDEILEHVYGDEST